MINLDCKDIIFLNETLKKQKKSYYENHIVNMFFYKFNLIKSVFLFVNYKKKYQSGISYYRTAW